MQPPQVSAAFAIVYMVAIPAYLGWQIRLAVEVLDRNNPRHVRQFEAAERFRRTWRATHDGLVRAGHVAEAMELRRNWRAKHARMVARADRDFADAVADFDDARSALHCCYRRARKYFRLVATLERVLLLAASALLAGAALRGLARSAAESGLDADGWQLQRLTAAAIVAAFFFVSVALQPFASRLVRPARPHTAIEFGERKNFCRRKRNEPGPPARALGKRAASACAARHRSPSCSPILSSTLCSHESSERSHIPASSLAEVPLKSLRQPARRPSPPCFGREGALMTRRGLRLFKGLPRPPR